MFCYIFGLLAIIGPPQEQAVALHVVIESQFTFMASTQTTIGEYWITNGKTYEKRGTRVVIVRRDRGLQWVIDVEKGTYSEKPATSAPKTEREVEDIHTAGFNYEPEFAWTVSDGEERLIMDGRTCHMKEAKGTDSFAEMTLKLWLCHTARPAIERDLNSRVLDIVRFRFTNPNAFVTKILSEQPEMLLMSLEAMVEPPIAGTMAHRAVVRKVEIAVVPAGIFDLPSGIQKLSIKSTAAK